MLKLKEGLRPALGWIAVLSLLTWRLLGTPPSRWWRDWLLIVSLYWIYSVLMAKTQTWGTVSVALAAYLLGISLYGIAPHSLRVLGLAP